MKITASILAGVVGLLALSFLLSAFGLFNIRFWGVKYQNAQTAVYHQTDAYTMGNQRDFENLVLAYRQASSDDEKQAVLSTIRHRAYGVPQDQVPTDVRQLINN